MLHKIHFTGIVFALYFSFLNFRSLACQCPATSLSIEECEKYEVIFKGKVIAVKNCDSNFGEATFEVQELYRGNVTKEFIVLFECGGECAREFRAGDEWVIYSNYKQISNVKMDWCSRSRKFFKIAKEDYYTATYGNDYDDEVEFLRKNLGLHRIPDLVVNNAMERNQRPSMTQTVILLICSLGAMIAFYWLFRKYFHKL